MTIIFTVIGFIGLCLILTGNSKLSGSILLIISTVFITLNTEDNIENNSEVKIEVYHDTVYVHDTVNVNFEIKTDTLENDTLEIDTLENDSIIYDECECNGINEDYIEEEDTTDNNTQITFDIINKEKYDKFIDTIEQVIDSLENI